MNRSTRLIARPEPQLHQPQLYSERPLFRDGDLHLQRLASFVEAPGIPPERVPANCYGIEFVERTLLDIERGNTGITCRDCLVVGFFSGRGDALNIEAHGALGAVGRKVG